MRTLEQMHGDRLDPPLDSDLSGTTQDVELYAVIGGGEIVYSKDKPTHERCWHELFCQVNISLITDQSGRWCVNQTEKMILRSAELWDGIQEQWIEYKHVTGVGDAGVNKLKSLLWQDVMLQQGETFLF